ncbi:MAG: uncharacterized protein JWN77_2137 [Frankiales bacterium]|nr:uncharacterized protein [Frankiales bacterium]
MKKVVWLLVLVALLVGADRVAAVVAGRVVAGQLQSAGELSVKPSVSFGGFPFLTQAVRGRYSAVEVSASDVAAGGERLSQFDADLAGLRLPLSAALSGNVARVPVDGVDARVVLSYADLQRRLRDRRLALAAGPSGLLRVTGTVRVLGRDVSAAALSSVRLSGTSVVVTAQRFEGGGISVPLGNRLDFTVRIGKLPYGLALSGVRVTPGGIEATARGRNTVLTR